MTKKTRFKLACILSAFLMIVVIVGMYLGKDEIAGEALAALMVIGPAYILGDSYRKSNV